MSDMCKKCGGYLNIIEIEKLSKACYCNNPEPMNKPDDMPAVIYATTKLPHADTGYGYWMPVRQAVSNTKYHSDKSFLAAISELENKHKAEMLGVANEFDGILWGLRDEGDFDHALKELAAIKARIGGEHE
jgi:hypothetical protein